MAENKKVNFFKIIDVEKKKKKLYPDEVISFLSKLLEEINLEFDPEESLELQFNGLKKEEYDKMLNVLVNDVLENDFSKKDSSEKYAFSKILEDYIFSNLDIFFNYNIYMLKERKNTKNKIDKTLSYIYQLEETQNYIDPEEIILHIEEKKYENPKDIEEMLKKKIKKDKKAILKNNIKYMKRFQLI